MGISTKALHALLAAGIPGCEAQVYDLQGTQDHYKVIVIADVFAGKGLVERHQMVNFALREPLKGPLHALTIQTHTRQEWESQVRN